MIKGVIFDLDGVLCHTDEYHYLAWKKISDSNNWYFDREINNRLRGISRVDSLKVILNENKVDISKELFEEILVLKNKYYLELLENMSKKDLDNGVFETLNYLIDNEVKMCVASSSKNAPVILSKLGIKDLFEIIIDGNMITKSKPNPEVFSKAFEVLNINEKECLIVEDSKVGVEASNILGIPSVYMGKEENVNATYIIYKIEDLIEIFQGDK
ncbi:beta-phosphoglucomutase [Streptobacillus felis]|uniref:Beta-phosphoglucomutase n=1 Tax=Streptobacillus felis TaxID=1384509 RepID=A0A7Z0PGJ9_9FUSO|nr:beta-phosphoglucomutase [Streptobacillus felis]NYV27855.1 beta-phosphoglucomutase [Streptobacillus felis]